MNYRTIKLNKAFSHDYCVWETDIEATISGRLKMQMDTARAIIQSVSFIHSIDIASPTDFLSDETEQMLQDQCRYDVSHITVWSASYVFFLQAKWDAHFQAEYIEV